ncbi:MAG: LytTR family DNA-binding domain-containing protein [Saprospiraceae bacterium]
MIKTYDCIIIEDQPPAQRILIRYIEDLPELRLVGTFTDPLEALAFLRRDAVPLLFLDIHLPKISGMEFLKILPYHPKVILTTAFSEYALDGYEFDVADYLLKPISFDRFLKAVTKVIYSFESALQPGQPPVVPPPPLDPDFVFLKSDRAIIKIGFKDILYIKSEDDFTRVYMKQKNHFLSTTLKFWLDLLPKDAFVQIHKSFIINISCIDKIVGNQVYLAKECLPIGRSFKDAFLEKIDLKT